MNHFYVAIPSYSEEATQFLDRITATSPRRKLYVALIDSLVEAGVWDSLDALWIFAAENRAAAKQNLVSSSYTCVEAFNPTFIAYQGFTGNGTSAYLDTTFNPTTASSPHFTQNNASMGVWSLTEASATPGMFGWEDASDGARIRPRSTGNQFQWLTNQASQSSVSNNDGRGWYSIDRDSSTTGAGYRYGALVASSSATSAAMNNATFKTHFTKTAQFSSATVAAAFIGGHMTASQHSTLYLALMTLLNLIGAADIPGAWTWYNDPRAIVVGTDLVYGFIDTGGRVGVRTEPETGTGSFAYLISGLNEDDHGNPALLVRNSDQKLLAFFVDHNTDQYYIATSTNASDASAWETAIDIAPQLGTTEMSYANPVQLTGETGEPIYNFFRGSQGAINLALWYTKSFDGGVTWSAATQFAAAGRPYMKLVQNGTSRIDFFFSDGHPSEHVGNSLYHMYMQGGSFYKSDGTLITASLPLTPASHMTRIYDGNGVNGEAWNWDIQIDGTGKPVVAFATFVTTSDHRYRYAKWSGSAWTDYEVTAAGGSIENLGSEPYYSGGIVIDPDDINTVYYSRDEGGVNEIFKAVTANNGASWTETQLTSDGVESFRPYKAAGSDKLLYLKGDYVGYTSYNAVVVQSLTP